MATTKTKHRRTSKGVLVPGKGLAAKVAAVEKGTLRADLPKYAAGDTVRVHVRIKEGEKERIQAYDGVVIAKSGKGSTRSFTVRKISHGVGVERIFTETTPKIAKLEVLHEGKVRRAKLYYLRALEGKAARVEREVETQASSAASAASAAASHAAKEKQTSK